MALGFRHGLREARREGHEIGFGLGREAAARWHRLRGAGEAALLSRAQAIRFTRFARESLASYRRLDALIQRYGDAETGFDVPAATPERFVGFIGNSRSGHSLVGSLIDAHPDAEVAHELHALKHLAAGAGFAAVVRALRQNARIFQVMGRSYTGYDYVVPGQWQGACRRLAVVGDKKGNGSARLLRRDPGALARVLARVPVPLTFVHVIRNPYDNIATKALRTGRTLESASAIYFANAAKIAELKDHPRVAVHDVHLETLIAQPRPTLRALAAALALDPDVPGYLDACAEILFTSPARSRDKVSWPTGLIADIDARLAGLPFLSGYAGSFRAAA